MVQRGNQQPLEIMNTPILQLKRWECLVGKQVYFGTGVGLIGRGGGGGLGGTVQQALIVEPPFGVAPSGFHTSSLIVLMEVPPFNGINL